MAASPQFVATPVGHITQFLNADGTGTKTIFTPASSGSRLEALYFTSDDTAACTVLLKINNGTISLVLDQFTLRPSTTARPLSYWNALDPNRLTHLNLVDPAMILPSGMTLEVSLAAALSSGKSLSVFAFGGSF